MYGKLASFLVSRCPGNGGLASILVLAALLFPLTASGQDSVPTLVRSDTSAAFNSRTGRTAGASGHLQWQTLSAVR